MPEQPRSRDAGELGGYGGGSSTTTSEASTKARSAPAWKETFWGGSVEREQRAFRKLASEMRAIQARLAKGGRAMRGLHAKMLAGTSNAQLDVSAPELSGGYLVAGKRYDVTLRFSSASSRPQSDGTRDLRGLALRVHTPEGDCDLLLTNAECSHVKDAREFMIFMSAMSHGKVGGTLRLLLDPRIRAVPMLRRLFAQTSEPRRSLAHEAFFSRAPFLLGDTPVRYKLEAESRGDRTALATGEGYLFEDLRWRLRAGPLRYTLYAQPYASDEKTPLEDSSARWQTAYRKIATLEIPQQELAAPESEGFRKIDALRFSPWNTFASMRPLGSLNRARRYVYGASQEERARTQVPPQLSKRFQLLYELIYEGFPLLNKVVSWDKLPPRIGTFNLIALRERFRRENLFDGDDPCEAAPLQRVQPDELCARSSDGGRVDLVNPDMGKAGRRLGRNTPMHALAIEDGELLRTPDPKLVSERLLARTDFIPAPTLNLLAVAWIQFQTHDWFAHREYVPAGKNLTTREQMANALGVRTTANAQKGSPLDQTLPAIHENDQTHWWDCSQIYGHTPAQTARLRGPRGTLTLDHGHLPVDPETGLPITGFNDNWWVGMELMHTLFALEHNAICAAIEREQPALSDDQLFATARLVNCALMAKIHTVEWTPAILAHPTLKLAMPAHWTGVPLSDTVADLLGIPADHEIRKGIPGSPTEHFEAPFALSEEFVSVYRLHPMLPDAITMRAYDGSRDPETVEFPELSFRKSPPLARALRLDNLTYSLGHATAGAMCLHNYPDFLRKIQTNKLPWPIDLAAVDVFRDRERGVPRYNAFRVIFGKTKVKTFEELSSDPRTVRALREVYDDDIERVDLLVGLLSETPPAGFGFSDTAFRVFIGMTARRLKSDRFFTADYREELYTKRGLAWVAENKFKDVLLRHFPTLRAQLSQVPEAFAPWTPLAGLG